MKDSASHTMPRAVVPFLLCVLMISGPPAPMAGAEEPSATVRVVFRYDDFGNATAVEFDRRLIEAFRSRGMSATFGVIPFERQRLEGEPYHAFPKKVLPLRPEKAELLADAVRRGTVEAALHGYIHQEIAAERPWTEFATLPYEQQQRKIAEGKQSLEAVLPGPLVTFVPPFNSYDANTVKILQQQGFRILSAGGLDVPEGQWSLKFLPTTCELRLGHVRGAVAQARRSGEVAPIVVVMCHPHDFLEIDQDRGVTALDAFEELLDWLAGQDDVRVCTLAEAVAESGRGLSLAHYRNYCGLRPDKPYHLLPSMLESGCANVHFYPSPETLAGIESARVMRLMGLYGAIAIVGLLLAYVVLGPLPRLRAVAAYGGLAVAAGLAVLVFRDQDVYFRGAAAVAVAAGACLGAWVRYLAPGRRSAAGSSTTPTEPEATQPEAASPVSK